MSQDINLIIPPEAGVGSLYISDLKTAQSLTTLKVHKIGAIITATRRGKLTHSPQEMPRYLYLPVEDSEHFDISQYFQISLNFIEESRRHTNVLVHCTAGISRSATIVAAYLITKYNYSSQKAIDYLQRRRPKIEPNKGFRAQLQNICTLKKWTKECEEDEETISSPIKVDFRKSQSLFKSKIIQNNFKENPQEYRHARMQSDLSTALTVKKRQCESYSREKTASKIERVKASLINKFTNSSRLGMKEQNGGNKAQESIFSNLLHSKIYQNKLKVKY